jgi:Protein of unknown function (DUF2846)
MSRFLLLAVIILNLVGCASVPMGDAAQDADLKNFKATQNKSGVYIYRNETLGAAIKMNVLLNNVLIGQTAAKTYIYQEVAPGKHLLSSLAENTDNLQFEALPGQILFIWQEVKMGLFAARVKLQIVEPAVGKKGVLESKLVASTASTNNVAKLVSASTNMQAEDVNAVPYIGERGREIYRAYLTRL